MKTTETLGIITGMLVSVILGELIWSFPGHSDTPFYTPPLQQDRRAAHRMVQLEMEAP